MINISKAIQEINKVPCSEHEINILGGAQGRILMGCKHCEQRWLAIEQISGETTLDRVDKDYELPLPVVEEEKKPTVPPKLDIASRSTGKVAV